VNREQTFKTRIIPYYLDVLKRDEAEEYIQLTARLNAEVKEGRRGTPFHVFRTQGDYRPSETKKIELTVSLCSDNQWNTADSCRVFDWYEGAVEAKHLKIGYYLEMTEEILNFRRTHYQCGYTGETYDQQEFESMPFGLNISNRALASPYLEDSELQLLRLKPLIGGYARRDKLTQEEFEYLLPLYLKARTQMSLDDKLKLINGITEKRDEDIRNAMAEHDGKMWLIAMGIPLNNCIYYDHTQKFSFGWRKPMGEYEQAKMAELLKDFPFPWEFNKKK